MCLHVSRLVHIFCMSGASVWCKQCTQVIPGTRVSQQNITVYPGWSMMLTSSASAVDVLADSMSLSGRWMAGLQLLHQNLGLASSRCSDTSPRPLLSWALSAQNTVHPLSTKVWSEMLWWSQPESYFSFFFLHPLIRTSKCCVLFSRRQLDFLEKKETEIQYCFHIAAQRRGTAWMCQSSQIQDESHLHTPQSCMAKVTEPHQCFAN